MIQDMAHTMQIKPDNAECKVNMRSCLIFIFSDPTSFDVLGNFPKKIGAHFVSDEGQGSKYIRSLTSLTVSLSIHSSHLHRCVTVVKGCVN